MKTNYSYEDLKDPNNDIGFLILQVSNLWEQNHKKILKQYQLTHSQFAVLASIYWLSIHKNLPITQIKLANHIKTDPMNISQTIKGLEKQELVIRTICPTDVRSNMLTLTSKGEKLIEKAIKTIYDGEERFFKILGKNNSIHFKNYLMKLIKNNE